ncbi:hypothetical protein CMEL01_01076 [Colletotrichum melonis]|uniref:Transmembrane protein n=1 Tax=Colletotrichum melonis TaxID=1209925 RepID=A0AAI9V5U6_9PEZI|nr:hypothetical protein CMEL01_01076 [Colletotrichum melonis]
MMSGIKSSVEVKEGVMTLFSSSLWAFQLPFCVSLLSTPVIGFFPVAPRATRLSSDDGTDHVREESKREILVENRRRVSREIEREKATILICNIGKQKMQDRKKQKKTMQQQKTSLTLVLSSTIACAAMRLYLSEPERLVSFRPPARQMHRKLVRKLHKVENETVVECL